jgi:uncharacterized protein (DUF169 family)
MEMRIRDQFMELNKRYFNNAELPITFYYSDTGERAKLVRRGSFSRCVMGALKEVRNGQDLSFNADSIECFGGRRYLGFDQTLGPDFEYFLSCGIPGRMEGERYKKSPRLVKEILKNWPKLRAPKPYVVFRRWDNLCKEDDPEVVIVFAQPDVLAGLFTLANFDQSQPEGVIAPMGSGCSSIVSYPYLEKDSLHPRAIIGMFDPSARPYVPKDRLSFAVPMKRFITMIGNMEESFLITDTWQKLQRRILASPTKLTKNAAGSTGS